MVFLGGIWMGFVLLRWALRLGGSQTGGSIVVVRSSKVGVSSVHASRLSSVHAQTAVFCTRVPCDVLERNKIFKKWA